MRFAIVDLGTNTFNLIIVEPKDDSYNLVYSTREPVMLGEGGIADGFIAPKAFKRGTEALRKFNVMIEEYSCDTVYAFATSAIRSAKNGQDFVDSVKRKVGINISVIDGKREAELIYLGISEAISTDENLLMMDIGGGSTEFIIAHKGELLWSHSFDLGVSRLFQTFNPSDPISSGDVAIISDMLLKELQPLFKACAEHKPKHMVGSSGSFTTFAKVIAHKNNRYEEFQNSTEFPISLDDFYAAYDTLLKSTYDERLATPGIEEMRARYIVVSGILTKVVLDLCEIETIRRSDYNMKEGAIAEVISGKSLA